MFPNRYIDDVLYLKNSKFAEYMEFIYHLELEIKETTETRTSASYLDCYRKIDNGKLGIRLYDKRDDFNFPILNFPFLEQQYSFCSSIWRFTVMLEPVQNTIMRTKPFYVFLYQDLHRDPG